MDEVLNTFKPAGLTPLEAVKRFKKDNPDYKNVPITYAGRLDPLAEGVLVLLAGDKVHEKGRYLGLDKEYEAEILLGIKTDTFDILGIPYLSRGRPKISPSKLNKLEGKFTFSLPPYSSYKIKGKPLFWWAREGRLNEIKIPQRKTKIYDIKLLSSYSMDPKKLLKIISDKIDKVRGDFRQKEIKEAWEKFLGKEKTFDIFKIRVSCSSGTYIRSIANEIEGTILALKRTKVGDFGEKDSIKIK